MILELKGTETAITTATNFNNAKCIKLIVTSGTPVITITDADDVHIGNTTLNTGIHFIKKSATDKIASSTSVLGTAVSFTIG